MIAFPFKSFPDFSNRKYIMVYISFRGKLWQFSETCSLSEEIRGSHIQSASSDEEWGRIRTHRTRHSDVESGSTPRTHRLIDRALAIVIIPIMSNMSSVAFLSIMIVVVMNFMFIEDLM